MLQSYSKFNLNRILIICSVVALAAIIGIGPINLCYGMVTFLTTLITLCHNLLTTIIYPLINMILSLLIILAVLMIPISGLLIAGIFTCPKEESFSPWLKSFIAFHMMDNQPQPINDSWIPSFLDPVIKSWSVTLLSAMAFDKQKFLHCGAFRLVFCTKTSGDNKMTFIGAFNTWFPSPF